MINCVILGAGLGGLSTANALIQKGMEVLLIEGASNLNVKTCGEFLSHEALPILDTWGISPELQINTAHFYSKKTKISFQLPFPCGSMPRLDLEEKLLNRFIQLGGKIYFGRKVTKIIPGKPYQLSLDDDQMIEAKQLVISAGRWQGNNPTSVPQYYGIKNHFITQHVLSSLHMVFFKNGYVGISPITSSKIVVSCLMRKEDDSEKQVLFELTQRKELQKYLQGAQPVFDKWLTTPVGNFGCKKLPLWPNSYFVGDAAATIAPIFGKGMTIALHSGALAAEYILQKQWKEYRKVWCDRYLWKIRKSQMINRLILTPSLFSRLFPLCKYAPYLLQKYYARQQVESVCK